MDVAAQSSQAPANSEEEYWDDEVNEIEAMNEHYITLRANVVGLQYYKGLVGPNEAVLLVREPHNKFDPCVSSPWYLYSFLILDMYMPMQERDSSPQYRPSSSWPSSATK